MESIQNDTTKAKRASVSLTSGVGDKATRLTILARRTRGDGGETVVTITDAKKKTVRGMTEKYEHVRSGRRCGWKTGR